MKRDDVLQKIKGQRQELEEKYGVESIFLFGSTARNEAKPDSDVDLLVDFKKPVGLFLFIELQQRLETLLQCKVDLGTKRSLKLSIKDKVLQEAYRVI